MSRLESAVVPAAELGKPERRRLFEIFDRHYEGASPEKFEADLAEKDFVILLREPGGALQGFSTQKILRVEGAGAPARAVFSGDTVIAREYWGEQELVRGWCRFVGRVRAEEPAAPLFWFLITKGYRTYLYLPLFFKDYHPHHERPISSAARGLRDALAEAKYGARYAAAAGLLRADRCADRLRPELAETPAGRVEDERVAFYLRANPRYGAGEELVSVAEISSENLKGLARRCFEQGLALGPLRAPSGARA